MTRENLPSGVEKKRCFYKRNLFQKEFIQFSLRVYGNDFISMPFVGISAFFFFFFY